MLYKDPDKNGDGRFLPADPEMNPVPMAFDLDVPLAAIRLTIDRDVA